VIKETKEGRKGVG